MRRPSHFATRMMTALAVVIAVGAVTWVATAALVAPSLFTRHLEMAGETDPDVQHHAQQALASSSAISLSIAAVTSLLAAGVVSWVLVRRVARPIEALADAAESVASGTYSVTVPEADFSIELRRLSDAFSRMAQRLASTESSRSRLLADVAHEIRTPLATLEAYIDGLEDGVVPTDAASWATMRNQVSRLRRLAADLREAAAAEEHALNLLLQPTDLAAVVVASIEAARPRYLAKAVDLTETTPDRAVVVLADGERLQQVLANLLDNALRHTPSGGRVAVDLSRSHGSCLIRVSDTGDGLPADQLVAVFERFHRVDPARASGDGSGSGLGLTIARAIVTDHSGSLTAASPGPGLGATFTIRLPVSPPAPDRADRRVDDPAT